MSFRHRKCIMTYIMNDWFPRCIQVSIACASKESVNPPRHTEAQKEKRNGAFQLLDQYIIADHEIGEGPVWIQTMLLGQGS